MRINLLAQADIEWDDGHQRFWMDTCGGRDPVAMTVLQEGWAAHEPPLPALLAVWCKALRPVFVDLEADTGFYSLLAAATGATRVHACESELAIAEVLIGNAGLSESGERMTLHALPSAALEAALPAKTPVLIRIGAQSQGPALLQGAAKLLAALRPAMICKIAPEADSVFYRGFCRDYGYCHYTLASGLPVEFDGIELSADRRDHLFLPHEGREAWLDPLLHEVAQ